MRIKRNTETYIFIGKYLLTTHTFESTLALFRTTLPALEYSIKKTYIFEESIFGEKTKPTCKKKEGGKNVEIHIFEESVFGEKTPLSH